MIPPTPDGGRFLALVFFLALGLVCRIYPAQEDSLLQLPTDADTVAVTPRGDYIPAPELSPSTGYLLFDRMMPGESRTLFMDLANLGDGLIQLDTLTAPAGVIQLTLPLQTLRPGQFVRFPVTYTQTDLDTHHLEIVVHWSSPRFEVSDSLTLAVTATPQAPLKTEPTRISWPQSYVGMVRSQRIVLQNGGRLPIEFPRPPQLPADIHLSVLPQVLPGEAFTSLRVTWTPIAAGSLSEPIRIPYRVGRVGGSVDIALAGDALQPAHLSSDTLRFGKVFAGSSYQQRLEVGNGSGRTVVLNRLDGQDGRQDDRSRQTGRGDRNEWILVPSRIEIGPGESAEFEVKFSPRTADRFRHNVRFSQRLESDSYHEAVELPPLVLTVTAEVHVPLSAVTDRLDFGDRPVLETVMLPLAVTNQGAAPLRITANLTEGKSVYSTPPLNYNLNPGERFDIPIYFRPADMVKYDGKVRLDYSTFDTPQELGVMMTGRGLDRPLIRRTKIPDVTLVEDFPGQYTIADLTGIFKDANHAVTFRTQHPFGQDVRLVIEPDGRLWVGTTPNYYGAGMVVVEAVNELGHTIADTFRLTISSVNDLPRLMAPIPDITIREDSSPLTVGKLSEIFMDPDRTLDTVVTHYTIYSPSGNNAVRLAKSGDDLVLSIAPNWYGDRHFVVSARDVGDTNTVIFDAFKVSVLPVNDPPVVDPFPDLEMMEDDTLHWNLFPYVHDVDDSNEELMFRFTGASGGALPLSFKRIRDHYLIVQPRANWFGTVQARLAVHDPSGATASRDFSVRVIPVNDPPGAFQVVEPISLAWEQRLQFSGRDTLITFKWQSSPNPDPGDDVFYTWQLLDTTRRVLQELPAGSETYVTAFMDTAGIFLWTVLARDRAGLTTASDTMPFLLEALGEDYLEAERGLTFSFGPNYPNPFSTRTHIEYAIPRFSDVIITVYDAMGRKVRVLRAEPQYRGRYLVEWDGRDSQGQRVASGPYVAEIRAGPNSAYLKLVVVH